MRAFLDYISQKGPTDDFTKKLEAAVTKARQSKEVINEIMARNLFEHDAELRGFERGEKKGFEYGLSQGMSQGISQGLSQGISQSLKNLITNTHMSMEEAFQVLEIPESEREKYSALLNAETPE